MINKLHNLTSKKTIKTITQNNPLKKNTLIKENEKDFKDMLNVNKTKTPPINTGNTKKYSNNEYSKDKQISKTAKEMEKAFTSHLLNEMYKDVNIMGLEGSESEIYKSWMLNQYADDIVTNNIDSSLYKELVKFMSSHKKQQN